MSDKGAPLSPFLILGDGYIAQIRDPEIPGAENGPSYVTVPSLSCHARATNTVAAVARIAEPMTERG